MEYHTTEQVNGQRWEHEQSSVIEEIRRRAQHDVRGCVIEMAC
jgi:hypothetical protein